MMTEPWVEPALRIVHTIGFTILVGSIVMFDLRVLGFSKRISVRALSSHLLPWTTSALLVIIPSGVALFAEHATELLDSRVFKVKMALLLAAGINAGIFRTGPYQTVKQWDVDVAAPLGAKACVAASIAIWFAIIICGKVLASR